ncbi:hypothetical protein GCM10029964_066200 [Kibdelosporangium lantanae]
MKRWQVEILIDEHERATRAEARLRAGNRTHLVGIGGATGRPADSNAPEIADELAAARALSELAHQLLDAAVQDIEAVTQLAR